MSDTIKITALLFGQAREFVGTQSLELSLAHPATIEAAFAELAIRYPKLAAMERSLMFAINEEYASRQQPLAEGDRLAILPPVSGGEDLPDDFKDIFTITHDQRTWGARATPDDASVYVEHLTNDVRPKLERLDGFLGLVFSQRRDGDEVELVVQTYWTSMEAVERFAGPTPDVAVVEPEARAVLTSFDPTVQHHEVLVSTFASRASADPSTRSARSG